MPRPQPLSMRHRRDNVGCTNRWQQQQRDCHDHPAGPWRLLVQRTNTIGKADPDGHHPYDGEIGRIHHKDRKRERFVLPLLTLPAHSCVNSHASPAVDTELLANGDVKQLLAERIEAQQNSIKAFKTNSWYKSPIGAGSKASVVLAALRQHDKNDTGFVHCQDIVHVLTRSDFGLKEPQVRTLLNEFNAQLGDDDAQINYKTFVKKLHLHHYDDDKSLGRGGDNLIFRQQIYVEEIREHANQLVEKVTQLQQQQQLGCTMNDTKSSPAQRSGDRITNQGNDTHIGNPIVQRFNGSYPQLSPLHHEPRSLTRDEAANDRLSFEFDKKRKALRQNAKTRILLAHINRIETIAQQEQIAAELHENQRLAVKALHRHEHFAHMLEEENHNFSMVQKQCKGLVRSELAQTNRHVSKDSMFYVNPV